MTSSMFRVAVVQRTVLGIDSWHARCLESGCSWTGTPRSRDSLARTDAKKHGMDHAEGTVPFYGTAFNRDGKAVRVCVPGRGKMKTLPGGAFYVGAGSRVQCFRCKAATLAWAKSKRTGRNYLCETRPSQSDYKHAGDVRVALPWVPHQCSKYQEAK